MKKGWEGDGKNEMRRMKGVEDLKRGKEKKAGEAREEGEGGGSELSK